VQTPAEWMLNGKLPCGEEVGLALIKGYNLVEVRVELLGAVSVNSGRFAGFLVFRFIGRSILCKSLLEQN